MTSLHAVTVRENELSSVNPDRVMGTPATTSLGDRTRFTALSILRV